MRIKDLFLTLKVGVMSHVLVTPFEIFEILMEINREPEGRMGIRIGTSRGARSAINLMKSAPDGIVGKLDQNSYKSETKRISSEIPDPTFGYLRRSSIRYQEKEDALRNNLVEEDLSNLSYVDRHEQNVREMTFLRQKPQRMCRYPMRYTRGLGSSED